MNFLLTLNSVTRIFNTVAIYGTKVQLTIANRVVNGDVITVAYIKVSTNPLQTTSGEQAASLSDQTVINSQ